MRVSRTASKQIKFLAAEGVGTVTMPGIQIPVGGAAINPTPRKMILDAILEHHGADIPDELPHGYEIAIGCERGEEIAKRTFNPRLGIVGGISILGTTGIVEPKSMASFKASIEVYLRVAIADDPHEIVLAPGNLGQKFAREHLSLPSHRIVQMSNFIGFSLDFLERELASNQARLPILWVIGHPGKLAKLLANSWDTHSSGNVSAIDTIHVWAKEKFCDDILPPTAPLTVEGLIASLSENPLAKNFWTDIASDIRDSITRKLSRADSLRVVLFSMDGTRLN